MDAETLAKCTGATAINADRFSHPLTEAMIRFNITTPKNKAAFLATIAVESASLQKTEESLYYKDAQRLANIYKRVFQGNAAKAAPYTRNSAKLGQLLYKGYWGRGLIQLTWADNYINCGKALGFDYLSTPALLVEPWHASMSAGWFWESNGCNAPGDQGNMDRVTEIVNGPAKMHLTERKEQYQVALAVLT